MTALQHLLMLALTLVSLHATQLNMVTVESDKNMSAMNILKKEKDDLERYLQDFKVSSHSAEPPQCTSS